MHIQLDAMQKLHKTVGNYFVKSRLDGVQENGVGGQILADTTAAPTDTGRGP